MKKGMSRKLTGVCGVPRIFNESHGARKEQGMTKKVLFVAVLALLVVAVGAWNVEAKSYTPKTEKAKRLEAMEQYQFLFKKRYDAA